MSCSEAMVEGLLSGADAVAIAKRLRWAMRTQINDSGADADGMLGSLRNGSVLEIAVRPEGDRATVRVWFTTANRDLDRGYDEASMKKWIERMLAALRSRGWGALEE